MCVCVCVGGGGGTIRDAARAVLLSSCVVFKP